MELDQQNSDRLFFQSLRTLIEPSEIKVREALKELDDIFSKFTITRVLWRQSFKKYHSYAAFLILFTDKSSRKQWQSIRHTIRQALIEKHGVYKELCDTWNFYPPDWLQRRRRVLARDDTRCCLCKSSQGPFHVHHILPLSRGGTNHLENLVTLCDRCHSIQHPANPHLSVRPKRNDVEVVSKEVFLQYLHRGGVIKRGPR